MNPKESVKIYKELAIEAKELEIKVPAAHSYLFDTHENYYEDFLNFYLRQTERSLIGLSPELPPNDDRCNYCRSFHVGNLKNINKDADVKFGSALEEVFIDFCNKKLSSEGRTLKLELAARENENFHMPDIKVTNKSGESIMFLEFKCIFRPFIKINQKVNREFQCYSNSMTLDISNGKKLENQKKLVEQIGLEKVMYVYWYDLPCIKGIFWIPASDVYKIWGEQEEYKRRVVAGDYGEYGNQRALLKRSIFHYIK